MSFLKRALGLDTRADRYGYAVDPVMGYTAELAGLMISPGGLVVLVLMPLVGALSARVDARWLVAFTDATIFTSVS